MPSNERAGESPDPHRRAGKLRNPFGLVCNRWCPEELHEVVQRDLGTWRSEGWGMSIGEGP